ncbi:MAG: mycofactocin biosynthesis glycosyltransferase MftF [Actinomycetes bacterium]
MRYAFDRSVRRFAGPPPALLGGAPRRWFRLTAAGREALDRVGAGDQVARGSSTEALVDRLVDAGVLHPRPEPGSVPASAVTLVVPVRDRAGQLAQLLASVAAAGTVPARTVVVDDGSTDAAAVAAVVADAGAELVRRDVAGGPAAARNDGLAQVATDLVVVVDSDCTVSVGWLDELLCAFADPRTALAAPRVVAVGGRGPLAEFDRFRSPLDLGRHEARVAPGTSVPYVPAAALAARTSVLRDLQGFDASLRVGEDVDLVWRVVAAGHRVRYRPTALVHHPPRDGLVAWCAQRFQYGTSAAPLDARHPGQVAPAVVSRWSLGVWVPLVVGPPLLGALVGGAAAVRSARAASAQLASAGAPRRTGAELALAGHLGAGRQLARAVVRAWWPLALLAGAVSRRARRIALFAVVVTAADAAAAHGGDAVAAARCSALALLDDAAYGAGLWAGCVRARSFRALLPSVTGGGE